MNGAATSKCKYQFADQDVEIGIDEAGNVFIDTRWLPKPSEYHPQLPDYSDEPAGTVYVQAGAGVVADSDPKAEYEETRQKARALFRAAEEAVRFASGRR
jgi:hypothetical protein